MVILRRDALDIRATEEELARWRKTFDETHTLHWPAVLAPDLDRIVCRRLAASAFTPRADDSREIEHTLDDPALVGALQAVLNDPALWRLVERVTGCRPIGAFSGRVYRREARSDGGHYFPWHSDVSDGRLIGFSINLGNDGWSGGRLQIREAATGRLITDTANRGHGDALLFRIDPALEHQITPIQGPAPRTVLAGWFREGFDYWAAVR